MLQIEVQTQSHFENSYDLGGHILVIEQEFTGLPVPCHILESSSF